MNKLHQFLLVCLLATNEARSQGTLVYDQESSNDELSPFTSAAIQVFGTVGQSFVPSLSTVGFVQLRSFDINPENSVGATLVVNLRSNAINGPILRTSIPVALNDGYRGTVSFFFSSAVPVVINTTYFFEVAAQSGDNWGITTLGDTYSNGAFYGGGFPFSAADMWFREGIVVPEPTSAALVILGGAVVARFRRRKTICNWRSSSRANGKNNIHHSSFICFNRSETTPACGVIAALLDMKRS